MSWLEQAVNEGHWQRGEVPAYPCAGCGRRIEPGEQMAVSEVGDYYHLAPCAEDAAGTYYADLDQDAATRRRFGPQ